MADKRGDKLVNNLVLAPCPRDAAENVDFKQKGLRGLLVELGENQKQSHVKGSLDGSANGKEEIIIKKPETEELGEPGEVEANAPRRTPWQVIDDFRSHKRGMNELGDTIPVRGDGLGTVAFVEINDHRVFGVNSTALVRDADKDLGRMWRDQLGFNQGQAQSLFHGEAHSLMRAYEKLGGQMPSQLTLYVDRLTCGPCQGALPDLLDAMGIQRLIIRTKKGRVGEITNGTFRWLE